MNSDQAQALMIYTQDLIEQNKAQGYLIGKGVEWLEVCVWLLAIVVFFVATRRLR